MVEHLVLHGQSFKETWVQIIAPAMQWISIVYRFIHHVET